MKYVNYTMSVMFGMQVTLDIFVLFDMIYLQFEMCSLIISIKNFTRYAKLLFFFSISRVG